MLFLDRLERAIADARPDEPHLAVLFCDLDRFKQVNDTLGHAAGDELLRQVSARLRAAVRPATPSAGSAATSSRSSSPGLTEAADAAGLAERVVTASPSPFRLDGHARWPIGTSVGVAVHDPARGGPGRGAAPPADAAMYRHKQRGRRRCSSRDPVGCQPPTAR